MTVDALTFDAVARATDDRRFDRWTKRLLDVVGAVTLLIALAPVFVTLAVLVRATSSGPVLYRQVRVGRGGGRITVLKFRSMRADADQQLAGLRTLNEADGPLFKMRHDPRVTTVGRWIRRFSLDELPQLLNVLGGSMALVGPRPALPEETAQFGPDAQRRHAVKPGLTGLWQISGRSDLEWSEAVRLDVHYVDHWSITLDLVILLRTIPAVLSGRGAY